ncbi:MAG: ABC transporter permease [bacterium]|nr:ABC transporter permease [bacterium]
MLTTRIRTKARELYRYREMFFGLVNREVRARYKGSALGFLWSLLNPLMMLTVYSLIFSVYLRVNISNYPLFVFCGLLPWTWFGTSLTNGAAAIVANSGLIKKIYFPLEILPLVNVTTNLVNFVLTLPVLALFMAWFHVVPTWSLLMLPVVIGIQFVLTLGLALILSTANAFFRDVEQLLGPVLLAWFYLTPVVYEASSIPERFRPLLLANPMGPIITAYQDILFHGRLPDARGLVTGAATATVLFLVGQMLFQSRKFSFAEAI